MVSINIIININSFISIISSLSIIITIIISISSLSIAPLLFKIKDLRFTKI